MTPLHILPSVGFLLLWAFGLWRLRVLMRHFHRHKLSLSAVGNKALVKAEFRRRLGVNILAFLSLLPLPLAFFLTSADATDRLATSVGSAALAGGIVAIVKLGFKVKLATLFTSEPEWPAQLALFALGLALGTLLAVLMAMTLNPDLWSALRDSLKK